MGYAKLSPTLARDIRDGQEEFQTGVLKKFRYMWANHPIDADDICAEATAYFVETVSRKFPNGAANFDEFIQFQNSAVKWCVARAVAQILGKEVQMPEHAEDYFADRSKPSESDESRLVGIEKAIDFISSICTEKQRAAIDVMLRDGFHDLPEHEKNAIRSNLAGVIKKANRPNVKPVIMKLLRGEY